MTNLVHVETVMGEIVDDFLTHEETVLLNELEAEIAEGAAAYLRSCVALKTIRDQRLYRAEFPTFEDYCRGRWQFTKTHANRLIDHSQVVENLTPMGVIPEKERHTRPLVKLPPEKQRQVWQALLDSGESITAARVERAVHALAEPPSPPSPLSQEGEGEPEGRKRLDNPEAHNEHYTPDHILEAVYACFGGRPYLDPCSNDGTPNVKATRHYTRADNGLEQEWMGQVFINPPYNPAGELGRWTEKLLSEWYSGRISQALYLVPAYTDTTWWGYMAQFPVLLIRGRLTFKGNTDPARFPSALFYLGRNEGAFREAFCHLGDFWMRTLLED